MDKSDLALCVFGAAALILLAAVALTPSPLGAAASGELGKELSGNGTSAGDSPAAVEDDGMDEIAVLETTMGTIEIALDRGKAPATVENFVSYVKKGHYNGTLFHRVIDGFMIQGGGFDAEGELKPVDAPIPLESGNGLKNTVGTVAMARSMSPDSATSQFFINVADNSFLDYTPANPGYAVFGRVISGMDVVNRIKEVPTEARSGHEDWPVEDVVITGAYMKH